VQRLGGGHFGWAAGTSLSDHQVQWVEKTPSVDWFALVGASDRLVRSACFLRSQGKLSCTTCHDAHGPTSAKAMQQACAGCHSGDGSKRCSLAESERLAHGDDCASCHMTRDTPSDFRQRVPGVRLEAVDHFIRKRPPAARPLDAAPLAQHVTEIVPWMRLVNDDAANAIDAKELATNEALAWIASGLEQRAAPQLLAIAAAPPPLPALPRAIGDAYARALEAPSLPQNDPERARLAGRLRAARAMELRLAPDDVDALVRYAQASILVGGPALPEAESALRRALVIVPDDATALLELGGLLFRTGRTTDAVPLLQRATIVGVDSLEAHVILAVLACQKGDARAAVRHFENARRDAPRDRWILEQLANLYTGMGDAPGRAEIAHALQFVPVDARPPELRRSTRWLSPLR
jgi:tetratricopeptide (TPR) repeat protein